MSKPVTYQSVVKTPLSEQIKGIKIAVCYSTILHKTTKSFHLLWFKSVAGVWVSLLCTACSKKHGPYYTHISNGTPHTPMGWMARAWFPERVRHFSLYFKASRPAMRLTQPMGTGGWGGYLELKWGVCEADHLPSAAGAKNGAAIPPLPMSSWHCAYLSLWRTLPHLPSHHTNFLSTDISPLIEPSFISKKWTFSISDGHIHQQNQVTEICKVNVSMWLLFCQAFPWLAE
jgi:hypothetical protein